MQELLIHTVNAHKYVIFIFLKLCKKLRRGHVMLVEQGRSSIARIVHEFPRCIRTGPERRLLALFASWYQRFEHFVARQPAGWLLQVPPGDGNPIRIHRYAKSVIGIYLAL